MNASDLALLHGVTRESVRQWTIAGMPRRQDGSYLVAETITWRIQRAAEKERQSAAPTEDEEKKLSQLNRKLLAEAQLKELQLERELGLTISVEDVEERLSRIVGGFAAVANGRLTRFEREIVRTTTPADARKLTERIRAALMEGAHGLADELAAEADADDEEDSAA